MYDDKKLVKVNKKWKTKTLSLLLFLEGKELKCDSVSYIINKYDTLSHLPGLKK